MLGETDKINQIDNDIQLAGKPTSKLVFIYKRDPTDSLDNPHQVMTLWLTKKISLKQT
jgi:hypothetical protein